MAKSISAIKLVELFEPYVKRFGAGYVQFKDGTWLPNNKLVVLAMELHDKDYNIFKQNIENWYKSDPKQN